MASDDAPLSASVGRALANVIATSPAWLIEASLFAALCIAIPWGFAWLKSLSNRMFGDDKTLANHLDLYKIAAARERLSSDRADAAYADRNKIILREADLLAQIARLTQQAHALILQRDHAIAERNEAYADVDRISAALHAQAGERDQRTQDELRAAKSALKALQRKQQDLGRSVADGLHYDV